MILPDWVRRLFSNQSADPTTTGVPLAADDPGPDLQLLEVAQVSDLSGGMWLIVDRGPTQVREGAGSR